MTENIRFTVIEGGLSNKKTNAKPAFKNFVEFRYAEATRSRLMGVVGVHIVYSSSDDHDNDIHHFFYLDYEEYGIDNYETLITSDEETAVKKRTALFGGLGEPWVELSERECLYLIEWSYQYTLERGLELPEAFSSPEAIKFKNSDLGPDEIDTLHKKICVHPASENELINYFIMRLAGMDRIMADYLSENTTNTEAFPVKVPSALCSNTIDKDKAREGGYICESLVDEDDVYYLIISRVTVSSDKSNPKITSYELVSCSRISNKEASLIMFKEHFVVIHTLEGNSDGDRDAVKKWLRSRFDTMTLSDYDNTSIIMVFNSNNAHVNQKRYRIDNDLLGMLFYTAAGELIIDAISPIKAAVIAQSLVDSPVPLESAGAIKFTDSIMMPFIDSGFSSFIEYVQAIQK